MASRRDISRTDESMETTLSEGMERNLQLAELTETADVYGVDIKIAILMAKRVRQPEEDVKFNKPETTTDRNPFTILRRYLSVRSVLSTNSSFAERIEALKKADPRTTPLRVIGRGTFATVFEIPGTDTAIKKTLQSHETMHHEANTALTISYGVNCVASALFNTREKFQDLIIPRVPWYRHRHGLDGNILKDPWWARNGGRFPAGSHGDDKPGALFMFERAMPLPLIIRENLIRHFFDPEDHTRALADPDNRDCMIRPYLSVRWMDLEPDQKVISTLRNFPLYIDQMKDLDMDPTTIAKEVALGLAAGHWISNMDMLDVEFVVASRALTNTHPMYRLPPESAVESTKSGNPGTLSTRNRPGKPYPAHEPDELEATRDTGLHFRNRAIQMWLFDFDKCFEVKWGRASETAARVTELVTRTRSNDPYYPTSVPRCKLQYDVWKAFSATYIEAGEMIQADKIRRLSPQPSEEFVNASIGLPRAVMKEWMKQEMEIVGKEKFDEIKELAKAENWRGGDKGLLPSSEEFGFLQVWRGRKLVGMSSNVRICVDSLNV